METIKTSKKAKGGRPKKELKKDQLLGVKCSITERKIIAEKATMTNLTVSEYLREMGLTGKIDSRQKLLPPEVLELTGTLNHLAANLNQIAKKRNSNEQLDAFERAGLELQSQELKRLSAAIRNYLQ